MAGELDADLPRLHHGAIQAFGQIDDAVVAEARNRQAGFGIERDQLIAGRNQQNALVGRSLAVAPVRETAVHLTRATAAPRAPSSSRYIQSVSPVAASTATASRRVPAVK